jgi:hypothetical protein
MNSTTGFNLNKNLLIEINNTSNLGTIKSNLNYNYTKGDNEKTEIKFYTPSTNSNNITSYNTVYPKTNNNDDFQKTNYTNFTTTTVNSTNNPQSTQNNTTSNNFFNMKINHNSTPKSSRVTKQQSNKPLNLNLLGKHQRNFVVSSNNIINPDTHPQIYSIFKNQFENPEDYFNEDLDNFLIIGNKSKKPKFQQVLATNQYKQQSNVKSTNRHQSSNRAAYNKIKQSPARLDSDVNISEGKLNQKKKFNSTSRRESINSNNNDFNAMINEQNKKKSPSNNNLNGERNTNKRDVNKTINYYYNKPLESSQSMSNNNTQFHINTINNNSNSNVNSLNSNCNLSNNKFNNIEKQETSNFGIINQGHSKNNPSYANFSNKNISNNTNKLNFFVIDDKAINEYFREIQERKKKNLIKPFNVYDYFDNKELTTKIFVKNKSEIKDLLVLQEKKLMNKEIEERKFNQTCSSISEKLKKPKNKLIMSTSCYGFRLKKETLDDLEDKASNLKMARVQDWVVSLRGTSSNTLTCNNEFISESSSNNDFRFGKLNLTLKNNTYKGKAMRHFSPKQTEEDLKSHLKQKGKSEEVEHHKKYLETYVNGKIVDSSENFNKNNKFNRKMLVNIGSDKTPIWANIKETSIIKKDEKILKPGDYFYELDNVLQRGVSLTGKKTANLEKIENKKISQDYPLIKIMSTSNDDTNIKGYNNNLLPSIDDKNLNIKTNFNLTNREFATFDTHENDNVEESIKTSKQRILNKATSSLMYNQENKSLYIDNIKIDSKFINEINWNKNINLFSKMLAEHKKARENLNNLNLVGYDLAAIEKECALKIPGKKLIYKQQEKGCFDEEVILTSFDRIVSKKYKDINSI